jgi:type I restriction enzyme R subunit
LLFLRDVRSQLYFEQMKGRGTRTIDAPTLATVTPDAGNKTRFVLVDAVGVTESDKTDSRPLERKPTISFEKLLLQVAMGNRDPDTLSSLANRLARLDRSLSDEDKADLQSVGGVSLKSLAGGLLRATDPDEIQRISETLPAELSAEEKTKQATEQLAEEACKPIASNPPFRELLEKKRRDSEVTLDHISSDEVLSTGYDEERARGLIQNWRQFLEENQDEITALQILFHKPHGKRHLVYEELKKLAEAVARPPYHIAPAEVWSAYEHLEKKPLTRDPVKVLTNLITLVRHTVDPEHQPLSPFPELVEARFQLWLSQNDERFNQAQRHWLEVIKNYVALNGAFATDDPADYLEAWQSVDSGEGVPLAVAKRVFGEDPKTIIEELNKVLVA